MNKLLIAGAAALLGTVAVQATARADVFDFSYTSTSSFSGPGTGNQVITGTFTTGEVDPSGSFFTPSLLITGITGTYNGKAITGLLAPGTYYQTSGIFGNPGNDNILYYPVSESYMGSPTLVDRYGVSFMTATKDVNIYFGLGGTGDTYGMSVSGSAKSTLGTFTVTPVSTPVPEPGSLALLGTGLLGLGLLMRAPKKRT